LRISVVVGVVETGEERRRMNRARMVEGLIEMSGCFVDILGECVVCRWEILKILLFVGVVSDVLSGQQTLQTTFPDGCFSE
jgi:hypothetical protein